MACTVMAHIVMAHIVMAYIVMAHLDLAVFVSTGQGVPHTHEDLRAHRACTRAPERCTRPKARPAARTPDVGPSAMPMRCRRRRRYAAVSALRACEVGDGHVDEADRVRADGVRVADLEPEHVRRRRLFFF